MKQPTLSDKECYMKGNRGFPTKDVKIFIKQHREDCCTCEFNKNEELFTQCDVCNSLEKRAGEDLVEANQ